MAKKEVKLDKMLVCDALDERDFLRKKIMDSISGSAFIGCKKNKEDKVADRYTVEEYTKGIETNFQSVTDLIKRYEAIDIAITLSNATVMIVTKSGKQMTRAAAIALRKTFKEQSYGKPTDFKGMLIATMRSQLDKAVLTVRTYNQEADKQAESLRASMVGKDTAKKLSQDDLDLIEGMTDKFRGEFIDPLKLDSKLTEMSDDRSKLINELDSAIKVSNATTYIEF